jgi:hypothetical protein
MIRTILVGAAALALASFSPRHVNASEAPWCAVYSADQPGAWSCQYRSFEECYPNALAKLASAITTRTTFLDTRSGAKAGPETYCSPVLKRSAKPR